MVDPKEFEKSLGYLSEYPSPDGQEEYIKKVVAARRLNDPEIYDKILVTDNKYSRLLVSFATVLLIVIFLYGYMKGDSSDPNVMIYGSIIAIGSLLASGVSL